MKDIGKVDIETYIQNLISEGFGHKSNDATCNGEQPDEDDPAEPLPTSMQSENSQKVKGKRSRLVKASTLFQTML